jgi:hypothetical protein
MGPLAPNYGSYYGLGLLDINDLPIPTPLSHYIHTRLDRYAQPTVFTGTTSGRPFLTPAPQQQLERNLAAYRAAAVSYVLTPPGQALPQSPSTFTLVARTPSSWIYRLAGSESYFTAAGCSVASSDRSTATVSCRSPATLVRRETEMPGWSAAVDGHATPVRSTGGLFQAVTVPAGTHRVTFSFAPPNVGWGALGLLAGVLSLLGAPLVGRRRRARRGGTVELSPPAPAPSRPAGGSPPG